MTDQHMVTKKTTTLWAVTFVLAMGAAGLLARYFDFGTFWSMAVMVGPMLLLIPMVRSAEKSQASCGGMSKAMMRYNRRFLLCSFGYMIGLFAAVGLYNSYEIKGIALWIIAILPALPVIGMIWTMGRLLKEEDDEYLKMQHVRASLVATGLTLGLATTWGFLEMFELVPHVWMWAVFPVWALGVGLGRIVNKVRYT